MAVIANLKRSIDDGIPSGGQHCRIGSPMIEVALKKNTTRRLARSRRWQMVVGLEGSLWVTQTGDPLDYILNPGEVFIVAQSGGIVIEALADARFYVSEMRQAEPFQGKLSCFS